MTMTLGPLTQKPSLLSLVTSVDLVWKVDGFVRLVGVPQDRPPADRDVADAEWMKHIKALRSHWGLGDDFRPWTGRPGFKGHGVSKTPRSLSILDGVVIHKMKGKRGSLGVIKTIMKDHYVDLSQSLKRKPFTSSEGTNRTQTTSTRMYSYSEDRMLTGKEMLLLQGQSASSLVIPEDVKETTLHDLAGEGMAVPCVGLVLWSLFLTAHFP